MVYLKNKTYFLFSASDILDLTMIEELMTSQTVEPEPQKTKKTKKSPTKPPSPQQQSPPRLTHSFKEQRHPYIKDGRPQVKQVNNGKILLSFLFKLKRYS